MKKRIEGIACVRTIYNVHIIKLIKKIDLRVNKVLGERLDFVLPDDTQNMCRDLSAAPFKYEDFVVWYIKEDAKALREVRNIRALDYVLFPVLFSAFE